MNMQLSTLNEILSRKGPKKEKQRLYEAACQKAITDNPSTVVLQHIEPGWVSLCKYRKFCSQEVSKDAKAVLYANPKKLKYFLECTQWVIKDSSVLRYINDTYLSTTEYMNICFLAVHSDRSNLKFVKSERFSKKGYTELLSMVKSLEQGEKYKGLYCSPSLINV